jgi:ORF6N domain
MTKDLVVNMDTIENLITSVGGIQVMLDSDLANLYGVETRVLNQAVKRNAERFPKEFMFQLSNLEWENLKSQNVTSSLARHGGVRKLPNVFTEQGVAMLSAVLKSNTAVNISIAIIRAFVAMRKTIAATGGLVQRIEGVEKRLLQTDEKFERIFTALEQKDSLPKQGIFFNGQIFDAYKFVADLIRKANKSIVLIDNYVDDTTLQLFTKRKKGVVVTILTQKISKQLELDVSKFNAQYGVLSVKKMTTSHDRFLILDNKELYHIGASLKDLGNKIFGFSKMDTQAMELFAKIKEVENG